ncbi:MAG: penicillin-binding protein 1A [Rhodospirillales bacterium]
MKRALRALVMIAALTAAAAVGLTGAAAWVLRSYGIDLPDYRQLAAYEPSVTTRVYAGDGRLLIEYAVEKRDFVPITVIPPRIIDAFLAAEDQNFYSHAGIDLTGVLRAVLTNLRNVGRDRRPVGASTITQQVAKNFLLTNEVSYERKIKEAILAFRMERAFPKDRILELYLNEIYLGIGSYGVAAAALNYFNKSLDELTVPETAYLAALPKAPNNYHPGRHPEAARGRRDWVIGRMLEEGFISRGEAEDARATELKVSPRAAVDFVDARHFAEEVRRELIQRYGQDGLYGGGLSVRTPLDPRLQAVATRALRRGLEQYDFRHGWRGPLGRAAAGDDLIAALDAFPEPPGLHDREIAVVTRVTAKSASIYVKNRGDAVIPLAEAAWARPWRKGQTVGPPVARMGGVLSQGDIIAVRPETENRSGKAYPPNTYGLSQIPGVDGAIVALDPHTGRVFAMVGGYDYAGSEFNRAVQARRQPGSAFKPFVYLTALEQGLTPSTLILDAPFVIDQGPGLPKWRPDNYTRKFYGPSTMRLGIEKSRNLMTVRLAQTIGVESIAETAKRFGVAEELPKTLAMSLGAGETSLLDITAAYGMLVNGGRRITPTLIDRIQDRHGRTVLRHDRRRCRVCRADAWTGQPVPHIPDRREQVASAASSYQIVSMLEGVVRRGTGRRISEIGKPLAGKTGTTNNQVDTWFVGFSPDLAVGVFIGFDQPKGLGKGETGSSVAAPVFKMFMEEALAGKPAVPFRVPSDIRLVRVDAKTGRPVSGGAGAILEAFKPGDDLTRARLIEGESEIAAGGAVTGPSSGTGGLY